MQGTPKSPRETKFPSINSREFGLGANDSRGHMISCNTDRPKIFSSSYWSYRLRKNHRISWSKPHRTKLNPLMYLWNPLSTFKQFWTTCTKILCFRNLQRVTALIFDFFKTWKEIKTIGSQMKNLTYLTSSVKKSVVCPFKGVCKESFP